MRDKMLCWPLFGVGFDKLGRNREPCLWDVPTPAADELLVRIDAIGLCFSDVKLIRAGEQHPRVFSENLETDPVIPGHEAVMTVVEAGDQVSDQYPVGSRYIIQADIWVDGVNIAYGYAINGGMAQYSLIDQRVLSGDEGCYLLPLSESVPAAAAALIEPWTCVLASYMIEHRTEPKGGGRMLVAMEPGNTNNYRFGNAACAAAPTAVDCLNVNPATVASLRQAFPDAALQHLQSAPGEADYDDIVICDVRTQSMAEALAKLGAKDALVSFVGDYTDATWSFDVGSIHYQGWFYQGARGCDIAAAYGRNVRTKLRKGGSCWLLGGAGAMGQMHTQLAVEDPDGPARILVTDLDSDRIAKMMSLLQPRINERGIEVQTMNPRDFASDDDFMQAVGEFAPGGFDDVVMLVPVPAVLTGAMPALGSDGLMNIFAGIPAGKEALLSVSDIVDKGARYVGSSGSRTHHLQHALELVESGKLNTTPALAAIGGMRALWEGINAVADARFPGKTVILPACEDMPLAAVEALEELAPGIEATFTPEGFYSLQTEEALLAEFGSI